MTEPTGWRRISPADVVFVVLVVGTVVYFHRLARRISFNFDDWGVAARPGDLGDLLEHFNGHLSLVPLAVYRTLYRLFGFEHYAPFRLLGFGTLVLLGVALYLLARHRIGAWPAIVVAICVMWAPSVGFTAFLFNFYLPLVLGVACAAVLPSDSARADAAIAASLAVALATSSVGVPVAVACGVYAVLDGFRFRRWAAIGAPTALWLLWWVTKAPSNDPGTTRGDQLGAVLDGLFGSFEMLGGGTTIGGIVVLLGSLALFVWRIADDRDSARMQVAWTLALVAWWVGVAVSREFGAIDAVRYEFVGAVLVAISLLPTKPMPLVVRRTAHPAVAAVALVATAAVVLGHVDSIRTVAGDRTTLSTWASNLVIEVSQGPDAVPDSTELPHLMYRLTAGELRAVLERRGNPWTSIADPDARLVFRSAILVVAAGAAPEDPGPCVEGPTTLEPGAEVHVIAGTEPIDVVAQRFDPAPTYVRTVAPGTMSTVRVWGPTVATPPWSIDAPGGCLVVAGG